MSLADLIPLAEGGSGALVLLLVFVTLLAVKKLRWGHDYDDLKADYAQRLDEALEANRRLEEANDVLIVSLQSERDQKSQLMSNGSLINQLFTLLVEREHARGGDVPSAPAAIPGVSEEAR